MIIKKHWPLLSSFLLCLVPLHLPAAPAVEEEIIIEEDPASEEEIILLEETAGDENQEETILIEEEAPLDADSADGETLVIEPEPEMTEETLVIEEETPEPSTDETEMQMEAEDETFTAGIDRLWLEYAGLTQNSQSVDSLLYGQASFSAKWLPSADWEVRIGGRIDGYQQTGTPSWSDTTIDYGETFVRFRGEDSRVTFGAQKIIWGRIDEVPPTDRFSTHDLRRFILDDLQDRRLARLSLRMETFLGDNKLDLVYLPTFRKAELPDTRSIWFPIDRNRGKLLGVVTTPALAAAMATSKIDNKAPDTDHGLGLRFSQSTETIDYALTVQHARQTVPYFSYVPATNTFEARYPRSWSFGSDLAFEADGTTWRAEVVYLSDVPVTRKTLSYDQVAGLNWAVGMEFYPGDGDTRVNLQLTGNHLLDTPEIVERDNVYGFNGSINMPFAEDRWKANLRFFVGLDKKDNYLNPEITFVGWEPHEFYLEAHYFDGREGTLGGFHQDHNMINLGWRARF